MRARSLLLLLSLGCDPEASPKPGDAPGGADPVDEDGDGSPAGEDCDDGDPGRFPGADEACDGVDNDCDGQIDEDPVDPASLFADADGDGFGADPVAACPGAPGAADQGGDCDDADPDSFPGADETCDGADNDCDAAVDEAPPDGLPGFADLDGDGFGDPAAPTTACALGDGVVDDDTDCDDADPTSFPGADEVCDGADNDCDGQIDFGTSVPGQLSTLQEAADLTADGGTICVDGWAPLGADLTGRELRFDGDAGGGLDGSAGGTLRITGGAITLAGLPVVGRTIGAGEPALIEIIDGEHTFEDLRMEAVEAVLAGGDRRGAGIRVEQAGLTLRRVAFVALRGELTGPGDGVLQGLAVDATDSALTLEAVDVDGAELIGAGSGRCRVRGGAIAARGGSFTATDLVLRGTVGELACGVSSVYEGGLVHLATVDAAITGARVEANRLTAEGGEAQIDGLIDLSGGECEVVDLELLDNDAAATASATSLVEGVGLHAEEGNTLTVRGMVGWNNTIAARSSTGGGGTGTAAGPALFAFNTGDLLLRHLDLRANASAGERFSQGGAAYLSVTGVDVDLGWLACAGNAAGDGAGRYAYGGCLQVYANTATTVTLGHADLVGNTAAAEDVHGGGLKLGTYRAGDLALHHVTFAGNTLSGTGRELGSAVDFDNFSSSPPDITYGDVWDQAAPAFTDLSDPTGAGGNLAADPLHAATADPDPRLWDLRLQAGSALIDAGDPALADPDGGACDIGAYGGPEGDAW
jgi:hypothetical protein